ncbi:MAG: RNA-binding S4 domain-containing protein [Alphaproteobacteria bacterium]
MTADQRQRIDKWLWYARLARTRTAAQKLSISGQVRVNKEKNTSASRLISPDDVLTVATRSGVRVLRVRALGIRRGPAAEARELYEDISPTAPTAQRSAPVISAPAPLARPGKRDRRALIALQRSSRDDFSSGGQ